jgi:hypothetical protein
MTWLGDIMELFLCYHDINGCIFTGTGRNITFLSDFDAPYILKQHQERKKCFDKAISI